MAATFWETLSRRPFAAYIADEFPRAFASPKARRFDQETIHALFDRWRVPPANQPRPGDYGFDLDRTLSSVVGLHSIIPPDAFSAETLGTERAGNGVVIDNGLVLTIGYLITEAERSGCIAATAASWRVTRSASISNPALAWCRRWAISISIRCRSDHRLPRKSATAWWSAAPVDAWPAPPSSKPGSRPKPAQRRSSISCRRPGDDFVDEVIRLVRGDAGGCRDAIERGLPFRLRPSSCHGSSASVERHRRDRRTRCRAALHPGRAGQQGLDDAGEFVIHEGEYRAVHR